MTDYDEICYHAVTLENVQPQQTQPNGWCLASVCAITCHCEVLGSWVSLRQKPWRWAPVRMSVWCCLQRKLSCCCKCCTAESWSQSASMQPNSSWRTVRTFLFYRHWKTLRSLLIAQWQRRWIYWKINVFSSYYLNRLGSKNFSNSPRNSFDY